MVNKKDPPASIPLITVAKFIDSLTVLILYAATKKKAKWDDKNVSHNTNCDSLAF